MVRTSSLSMKRLSPVMRNAAEDLPPDGLRSLAWERLSTNL